VPTALQLQVNRVDVFANNCANHSFPNAILNIAGVAPLQRRRGKGLGRPNLGDLHSHVLALPAIPRLLGDAMLFADLGRRLIRRLSLPQHPHDLLSVN
jgi:hypothetical protein